MSQNIKVRSMWWRKGSLEEEKGGVDEEENQDKTRPSKAFP
jgi:hypothetical protein